MTHSTDQLPPPGDSHFFIITLARTGRGEGTFSDTITPRPGETRQDVYNRIRERIFAAEPQLTGWSVSYFSLEPNQP